jgi:hypothetical protein
MTRGWERALDDCEARLDAAGALLERGGAPAVNPFSTPAVTGPIPTELVDRARLIVDRGEALEQQLTDRQQVIRAELRRLPRMPRPAGRNRFDTKA